MDFNGAGSLDNAVFERTDGRRSTGAGSRDLERHGRLVSAGPAGDGPRPDQQLGAIIDHVDFSAFGTVLDESSPSKGDRMMGFAGMERDTVTGLNLAVYRGESGDREVDESGSFGI